jgi:sulfite oxidase
VWLSLADLKESFAPAIVPATLQCAGNRRQELMDARPIAGELGWGAEAIGHAEWSGVRLRDVLLHAGLGLEPNSTQHAIFDGLDETERLGGRIHFGGSIPLEKALGPEVILAHSMNGQPLLPAHGFPLRVVVPGYIGARSVKWLRRIAVQDQPSANYFQSRAYRLFAPEVNADNVVWDTGQMLGETTLTSVICSPGEGERLPAGRHTVQGYAAAAAGGRLARVEVSPDGGQTWGEAALMPADEPWTWRLWRANVNLEPGRQALVVRAFDTAGNGQPPDPRQVWNFKGYMNNAWHRVNVVVGA